MVKHRSFLNDRSVAALLGTAIATECKVSSMMTHRYADESMILVLELDTWETW